MPIQYSPSLLFLESLAGYVICLLVAVIGLVVVWKIATGSIDISTLLTEKTGAPGSTGSASMARFQLLIFIFVIALSFFLVVISNIKIIQARPGEKNLPGLPDVPNGVLALLGISASSYAVGKAIQHGSGTGPDDGEGGHRPAAPAPGQPRI
jgi:hypothetical protein